MIFFGFLMNALVTEIVSSYSEIFSAYSSLVVFHLALWSFILCIHRWLFSNRFPPFTPVHWSCKFQLSEPSQFLISISPLCSAWVLLSYTDRKFLQAERELGRSCNSPGIPSFMYHSPYQCLRAVSPLGLLFHLAW